MPAVVVFVLAILIAAPLPAAARLAVFDAHLHYNGDSRSLYATSDVLARLDRAGVRRALVSSTPNEGTLALHERATTRFVPLLRPYRSDADRGRWYRDDAILEFVQQQLSHGIYRGIGEFHLHGQQAAEPVVHRLLDLAHSRDLLLHAHVDRQALDLLYAHSPEARILWAHAGLDAPPETLSARLERHRTLWIELSLRDEEIAPGGRLDPRWRALFERHPDRILLGSDTWAPHRWESLTEVHDRARRWLAELPGPIANAIAYGNAERLFPAL